MEQIRKYFLFALVLIAIAYVGAKIYLYYNVKDQVERGIAMAGPYAAVSYDGISSNLAGSVSVEGLEIRARDQVLPLRIDEVRLSGEGIGFLFDLADGIGGDRVPPSMRLELLRLELPDMNDMLSEGMSLGKASKSPLAEPADPCSLNGLLQRIGLFRSDAYPLIVYVNTGYELDVSRRLGRFEFGYRVEGRESVEMLTLVSGMPQPGAMLAGALPVIEKISIAYRPGREYVSGMVSDCAKSSGLSMPLYVGGMLAQPDERIISEMGFVPGPGLRRALERILLQPEAVLVELGPIEDMSVFMTPELAPRRVMDLLNLRLSVNDEPVLDLSYQEASAVRNTAAQADHSVGGGGSDQERQVLRPPMRFIETEVSDLGRHLGRDVRLYVLKHERPHLGALVQVGDGEVSVEKRVYSGRITVHVPLEGVIKAEVRRYPDTER